MDVEKCQLRRYPAGVLAKAAGPVERIDDSVRRVVEKMTDVMIAAGGVGLAGPQIGVPLRIFIVSLDSSREAVRAYINPDVSPEGELEPSEEGCLSVPGVSAKVRRYSRCRVTATGLDGKRFSETAEGLHARVLQHEADHIDGITIVSRMGEAARIAHRRRLRKLVEAYDGRD
jgi:peptide deformylase